jgi:hypothetical protein
MMIFMLSHYRLLARIQGQLFLLPKTPAPVLQGRGLNFFVGAGLRPLLQTY